MLIKQKSPSLPRNLACRTFGELSIVFLTKLNLLYLLYSTAWKCCLLHLIKQSWKISSVVPVFKIVGERSTAKNYHPVSLLSVVSKVFEKLVNNRFVDHQEKCGVFSDLQYDFRSSRSTADLLSVVFYRIARAFHRSGATRYI